MGLFSNFFGGKSRSDAAAGHNAFRNAVSASSSKAKNALSEGYDAARGRFDDYEGIGRAAADDYDLYRGAIGLRGEEGYGEAFDTFEADPFRAGREDANALALRDVFRRYNAGGMADSGASRAAVARTSADLYDRDVADFRNRLAGAGQYGMDYGRGIAGQLAGYDANEGAGLANIETGTGNALAHSQLGQSMYDAETRNTPLNNLANFVGAGANAFGNVYGGMYPRRRA
jgi:hypothetical protein